MLLLAATSCWGASSAALAHVTPRLAASAPLVAFGGTLMLLLVAVLRHRDPVAALRANPSLYTRLGALEAINLALYVGALRLGPVPVVVALHLTSPVILIAWSVVRRRRVVDRLVILELVLIVAAILIVALTVGTGASAGQALAGSALALGSAVALALLISLVARSARDEDPDAAAVLQLALAAVLTLPLALAAPPAGGKLVAMVVIGFALLGPGFALYWRALRGLDATMAGILGLNEALVASVLGALLFDSAFDSATVVAALLVGAAVALELRGRGGNLSRLAGA